MKQTTTVHQISDFDTTEMYEKLEKKMKPLYDQLYTTDNEKKIVQLHKQIKKITEAFDEKLFASRNKYATMKLTNVEDGDLVEFTKESGHRSEGIFIIRKTPKRFQLKKLSREFDDYGYVGDDYSLGPDKLPGYWDFARFKFATWHTDPLPEPVGEKYWKNKKIQKLGPEKSMIDLGWTKLIFHMSEPDVKRLIEKSKKNKVKALYFEKLSKEVVFYPDWS